ncbi:MAG: protein kinase [Singulisphaera sp.]|nr:protein kinase [Singulisphaera sp.]
MLDPEPLPRSERSETTGTWQAAVPSSSASGMAWSGGDPPTVLTGSSVRRARMIGEVLAGPLPMPGPGDRIDSFELHEAIGVGGMGAVFRANDTRLDRQVALKILPPEQSGDAEVVQRFYQEGRAAARLDHENIARVYTIGYDGKYHYIAFEFIEGTTLRQRVERDGPLPVDEVINYTLQIAGALVHAAERGVVHRDIKPSNIIVTPQGRAKLVDMGLARRFERGGDDGLTQSGMTLGTFDYISPEQARDPRDVDVRSDLYSLGCTLFHMLTGRPPFPEGTVLQKLLQHQEEPPPNVRRLNPEVPPDLASILVKLMAKDRDRRYQTPEQLVRDLMTVAGALGLRSVSPEGLIWMSAAHPAAWERHLIWGIPTVALMLVVLGLVWWGQESSGPTARPVADGFTPLPVSPAPPRPIASPQGPKGAPVAPIVVAPEPSGPEETPPDPPRDISVDSREDLLDVLAKAPPRSIVVLADNGPYLLRRGPTDRAELPRLVRRDLMIKAEAGVRPVLRLARDAVGDKAPSALFDFLGGRVTFEGLEFDLEPVDRDEPLAAIRTEDTDVIVRRCLFRRQGTRARRGRLAGLDVRTTLAGERHASVFVDACHFDGGQVGVLASGPADLEIRDCTFGGTEPAVTIAGDPSGTGSRAELRLTHDSILAGEGPVFRFEGIAPLVWVEDTVIAPARDAEITLVATDDPEDLDWRGRANLYARVVVFLQPTGRRPGVEAIRDWSVWKEGLAKIRETGSLSTRGRVWEDADHIQALALESQNPTPAFRLAATRSDASAAGARKGPFGTLEPVTRLSASPLEPSRVPRTALEPAPARTGRPEGVETGPAEPLPRPVSPPEPQDDGVAPMRMEELPEMGIKPNEPDEAPGRPGEVSEPLPQGDAGPTPRARAGEAGQVARSRPDRTNPDEPDSAVLRISQQLLDALDRPRSQ